MATERHCRMPTGVGCETRRTATTMNERGTRGCATYRGELATSRGVGAPRTATSHRPSPTDRSDRLASLPLAVEWAVVRRQWRSRSHSCNTSTMFRWFSLLVNENLSFMPSVEAWNFTTGRECLMNPGFGCWTGLLWKVTLWIFWICQCSDPRKDCVFWSAIRKHWIETL